MVWPDWFLQVQQKSGTMSSMSVADDTLVKKFFIRGLTRLFFADPAEAWNHEFNVRGRRHYLHGVPEKSPTPTVQEVQAEMITHLLTEDKLGTASPSTWAQPSQTETLIKAVRTSRCEGKNRKKNYRYLQHGCHPQQCWSKHHFRLRTGHP